MENLGIGAGIPTLGVHRSHRLWGDECLSLEWFRSRAEAAVVIETWRRHYNAVRPHSSINYLTPHEFKQQHHPIPNRAVPKNDWLGKARARHRTVAGTLKPVLHQPNHP